jgi:hypothetical protein
MKTTSRAAAVAVVSLFSLPAFAQHPVPVPGGPPAAPAAPGAPASPAPAAPAAPAAPGAPLPAPVLDAPADAAPPEAAPAPLPDRVQDLEGKVEGLQESLSTTQATLSPISKLKFSGYVQGRYVWQDHDDSISGVDSMNRPTGFDYWLVRRGRLKATYTGENAEYMLQIDAIGTGVTLKDAEATFVDTWTPLNIRVTVGQFKVPFGYEVLQSSADREMPERARVIRALFPNERDRGLRLTARWEWLRFMGAVVNGNFTNDAVYGAQDQNRYMNTYLRLGADFDFLVFNVSYEFGQNLPTSISPSTLTITDTNMNGVIDANEVMRPTATMRLYDIWRLGADAQFYVDIPGVGGLAVKGEMVLSKDTNKDFRGVMADPCRNMKGFGWILGATQNIRDSFAFTVRFDQWNPNRDVQTDGSTSATCMTAVTNAANDKISTLGLGPIYFISGNLKASAIYEHLWRSPTLGLGQPGIAPANAVPKDQLTFQLQARF